MTKVEKEIISAIKLNSKEKIRNIMSKKYNINYNYYAKLALIDGKTDIAKIILLNI